MKASLLAILLFFCSAAYAQTPPVIQWQKSLGGSGSEYAYSIIQTTDGGYMVAGYTSSTNNDVTGNHGSEDGWIAKLNAAGELQW